jgi:hypothetical protein
MEHRYTEYRSVALHNRSFLALAPAVAIGISVLRRAASPASPQAAVYAALP